MRRGQSRRHSMVEAALGTALGYGVAVSANMVIFPLFGIQTTFGTDLLIAGIFTVISFIRSYFIRRLFNFLHEKEIL